VIGDLFPYQLVDLVHAGVGVDDVQIIAHGRIDRPVGAGTHDRFLDGGIVRVQQ
jgi:hypothetical protein